MDMNTFRGLETAALLVLFIGLVIWAYSGKRKKDFDEAANMPLNEEDDGIDHSMNPKTKSNKQGESHE
ncbi:cbb3-type cytochrome oxidase subunit 3 [Pleionea litopenaei]|uniref:Cbb3-type cytochrome c oxidase subunit 3 n=1 Tax=Pleionea litopenaei TaxID=3070815 RepID=A0AA51RT87_9GAMM|nr:cbb3-type cytochrome c oxidase subunit 3 [Pleionea sp. HL-JVS1]WMS87152.1 cbb3-type cytochrome c oxidase subunit 3 [Pleionea sp. HL-JVS1]